MAQELTIEMVHKDNTRLAETVGRLTIEIGNINILLQEMKTDRAVRVERDHYTSERLIRIEESIRVQGEASHAQVLEMRALFGKVTKAGWWVAGTFLGVFVVALANFVINGGLVAPVG